MKLNRVQVGVVRKLGVLQFAHYIRKKRCATVFAIFALIGAGQASYISDAFFFKNGCDFFDSTQAVGINQFCERFFFAKNRP